LIASAGLVIFGSVALSLIVVAVCQGFRWLELAFLSVILVAIMLSFIAAERAAASRGFIFDQSDLGGSEWASRRACDPVFYERKSCTSGNLMDPMCRT